MNPHIKKFILSQFGGHNDPAFAERVGQACRVIRYKKKDILFMEQQPGCEMFWLDTGLIKLYRLTEEGKESVIHFVSPGEIFAEIILKPGTNYPVTATALEDSVVVALDVSRLFDLMQKDRDFMQRFTAMMAWRLKTLVNTIHNLSTQDVASRFMGYLKQSADHRQSSLFRLPAPKREIALLLGTTPETLSRIIKKLSAEGVIEIKGQTVLLKQYKPGA